MPQPSRSPALVDRSPPVQALARVTLASIERRFELELVAQYNPAQLQLEESASWQPSPSRTESASALEFTGGGARSLGLELFFDTYEAAAGEGNVKTRFVDPLSKMLRVMDPDGDEALKRPPVVALIWGTGMASFCGVLTSLSTKLTMFRADGTPVRATCSIKMLEATRDSFERRPANRVVRGPR